MEKEEKWQKEEEKRIGIQMEKEEAALTVTEQQPVWPRCTFHLRRANDTHAKLKKYIFCENY